MSTHEDDSNAELVMADHNSVTAKAVSKRARLVYARIPFSGLLVFLLNLVLQSQFSDGGFMAYVFSALVILAFVAFLYSVAGYFALVRLRRILRSNPWIEWYARVDDLKVFNRPVARVAVLAHPDWTHEETRTLHPRRLAAVFEAGASHTVLAAGNPNRTMAVSNVDGDVVLVAWHWMPDRITQMIRSRALGDSE